MINTNKVITGPKTLWTHAHVWEPKTINGDSKYSICLVINKDDKETLDKINNAIKAAYEDGKSKLMGSYGSIPELTSLKTPLRDGDADNSEYKNCYYLYASSKFAPGIVDYKVEPIIDRSQVYSGCYGRASISFYAYSYNKGYNKGIGCALNNLQKIEDGEHLIVKELENEKV